MKKTLIALMTTLSAVQAFAACPAFELPSKVKFEEKKVRGGTDFKIKGGDQFLGTVSLRNPTGEFRFTLMNAQKEVVAMAYERQEAIGLKLYVADCENRRIGVVDEKVWRNSFHIHKKYEIFDGYGRLIGSTVKKEFLATQFDVNDFHGQLAMTINRPAVDFFRDSWEIQVKKDAIDPRLALMLPAFKTSADNREKLEEKREKQEEKRREKAEDRREEYKKDRKKAEKRAKEERKRWEKEQRRRD